MNTEQKREAIRIKVCEAIPSIQSKNHESKGGNLRCSNCGELNNYANRSTCIKGKTRPILAQDILRALKEKFFLDKNGYLYNSYGSCEDPGMAVLNFELHQSLSGWSPETIDKLYELLIPEENLDEKRLSKEYFNKF